MTTTPFLRSVGATFRDATRASIDLFKVMVPIIIAVKILQELELVGYLAIPLSPIMEMVGLPASMGLVWATGIVVNIYSALIVYVSIAADVHMTVAQITTLSTMLLIAHGLPIECKVAQKCGPSLTGQMVLRVVAALLCGFLLHLIYSNTAALQETAQIFWTPGAPPETHLEWALDQARNLFSIYCLVVGLMFMMKILDKLRITHAINWVLRPILRRIGIGPSAATLTVVGLTLGMAYGSGLIIHESRSGKVSDRDVFYSLTLMGMAHALIEDTLLMTMVGAHISGIFWGRLVFCLLFMAILVQVVSRMSNTRFMQLFMHSSPNKQPA